MRAGEDPISLSFQNEWSSNSNRAPPYLKENKAREFVTILPRNISKLERCIFTPDTRVEMKEEILWNWINYDGYILNNVSECYFNRRAFRCFSKISLPCHITDIDLEKYEISKDLEISVKICGTIRLVSYRNPKFDREFEFSRRLLTVETGARASDIKRLAGSFDQALSFWRLLSRYERDSRSTLNGSAAKKLIIVPSTIARHHVPIRSSARHGILSFFEKHFHPLQNQSRCNRRTCCDAGNEHVEREERTYFRCFRCCPVAHLATDTFYSASSFCNARNEFTATTRAAAKHLRGNARKFVS